MYVKTVAVLGFCVLGGLREAGIFVWGTKGGLSDCRRQEALYD